VLRNEFLWIGTLGSVLLGLIAIGADGRWAPLAALRIALGIPFVLFVPGYALQAALFPRQDDPLTSRRGELVEPSGQSLDGVERLALSFGLSVAVVPPLALILDALPWGLRLWPIVIGEASVIALASIAALLRRRRLPPAESFQPRLRLDLRGWWTSQDRTGRVLYAVLAAAFLTAGTSAGVIVFSPNPADNFTEFYVLGPEGLAENYPREVVAGEQVSVSLGITNREAQAGQYTVVAFAGDSPVGHLGPIDLGRGETWQGMFTFSLAEARAEQRVDIQLQREGSPFPYRSLRLWMNVLNRPAGR